MSIDAVDTNTSLEDTYFDYANWALQTKLWDGHQVTWNEAADFQNEIEQRIMEFLFSEDPSSLQFQQFVAQLAWIGADESNRDLLARDIQELRLAQDGVIVQARHHHHHKSWLSRQWKEHKKEILIGVAIIAVATAIVAVSICTFGTASGAAVAAGGAALGGLGDNDSDNASKKENDSKAASNPDLQSSPPLQDVSSDNLASKADPTTASPILSSSPTLEKLPSLPSLHGAADGNANITPPTVHNPFLVTSLPQTTNLGNSTGPVTYLKEGVIVGDRYFPYNESAKWIHENTGFSSLNNIGTLSPFVPNIGQPSQQGGSQPSTSTPTSSNSNQFTEVPPSTDTADKSWIYSIFEKLGRDVIGDSELVEGVPLPEADLSRYYRTAGKKFDHLAIAGINGIATSFDGMVSHCHYLKQFAPELSIGWVYNKSHTPVADIGEAALLNYIGISPMTAELLLESWTAFHEENKDRPDAKFLQFGMSQGAIHIKNALERAPKEICERVMVITIAPAAVVPREACFTSFNYASENDFVYLLELLHAKAHDLTLSGLGISNLYELIHETHKELILLKPHQDATGIDHDFQSPTFLDVIKDRIRDYLNHSGEYRNKDECK